MAKNKMKELKEMHRHVTIFLPDGSIKEYATEGAKMDAAKVAVVSTIECDHGEVKIASMYKGRIQGKSYVGMPYILQLL